MIRILLVVLFTSLSVRAEKPDPGMVGPGLEIDLITENRSISAGKPFTVGLHIKHFPGFHTYWQNPGMVGMEPSLEWTLPDGFKASDIQWPHPEHTFMGEYPCYGYERDVTLLVTITPPAEITQKDVTLTAKAMWMCCAKGCFPGYETFNLKLPVTQKAIPDPKAKSLITKARQELPTEDHKATLEVLSKADAPQVRVRLTHPGIAKAKNVHLFSTDRQISSDHPQKIKKQSNDSIILTVPRSEFGPDAPTALPAVLQIGDQFLAVSGSYSK